MSKSTLMFPIMLRNFKYLVLLFYLCVLQYNSSEAQECCKEVRLIVPQGSTVNQGCPGSPTQSNGCNRNTDSKCGRSCINCSSGGCCGSGYQQQGYCCCNRCQQNYNQGISSNSCGCSFGRGCDCASSCSVSNSGCQQQSCGCQCDPPEGTEVRTFYVPVRSPSTFYVELPPPACPVPLPCPEPPPPDKSCKKRKKQKGDDNWEDTNVYEISFPVEDSSISRRKRSTSNNQKPQNCKNCTGPGGGSPEPQVSVSHDSSRNMTTLKISYVVYMYGYQCDDVMLVSCKHSIACIVKNDNVTCGCEAEVKIIEPDRYNKSEICKNDKECKFARTFGFDLKDNGYLTVLFKTESDAIFKELSTWGDCETKVDAKLTPSKDSDDVKSRVRLFCSGRGKDKIAECS